MGNKLGYFVLARGEGEWHQEILKLQITNNKAGVPIRCLLAARKQSKRIKCKSTGEEIEHRQQEQIPTTSLIS